MRANMRNSVVRLLLCAGFTCSSGLSKALNSSMNEGYMSRKAVMLEGDRRMVRDDVVSKKLTLKKGRNILRGAVINGPGMSDFCVRIIDGQGKPVRNLSIHVK